METVAALITTRWNSTRLKGKALVDIGGKPLIQWCVDRVKAAGFEPIVTTTQNSEPIREYCLSHNISCYVAPPSKIIEEENLILRMILCGDTFNLDHVIRIWGDNPFLDPNLMKSAYTDFQGRNCDYWDFREWAHGIRFSIYNHHSFAHLFHLMNEEDKWEWNYIDEVKGWIKYGFNVYLDGMNSVPFQRLPGTNINTPEDLETARYAVSLHGDKILYKDFLTLYG